MNLKVMRNGSAEQVSVKLGEFPSKQERASVDNKGNSESALEGVTVENFTPEMARQLKLPAATKGVVVDEVTPDSRAADAGLKSGDVIQEANHQPVKSVGDFRSAVGSHSKDGPVLLLVNREGNTLFLTV